MSKFQIQIKNPNLKIKFKSEFKNNIQNLNPNKDPNSKFKFKIQVQNPSPKFKIQFPNANSKSKFQVQIPNPKTESQILSVSFIYTIGSRQSTPMRSVDWWVVSEWVVGWSNLWSSFEMIFSLDRLRHQKSIYHLRFLVLQNIINIFCFMCLSAICLCKSIIE